MAFDYKFPVPPSDPNCKSQFARGFQHKDWVDGQDTVQAERTDDEVRLTASTLYDALARLLDDQVIDELERAPAGQPADGRRRYYRLTPLGRAVASLEARRLERLIDMARAKRLLPSARPRGRR